MQYQAAAKSLRSRLFYFVCTVLLVVVCTALFALPAAAQEEGPAPGTPAQGTNPDSPSSPPDLVTIAAEGCTVSEGASITLEDGDGTEARFVDGQLGIEITSTSGQITIEGPNDDYIGDHAFSTSDPGFDTDGDYAVVTTTGIACQGGSATTAGGTTTGGGTIPGPDDEQYDDGGPITKGNDEVIVKTLPQTRLPDTGGPPLAALLWLGAFVAASILLRRS